MELILIAMRTRHFQAIKKEHINQFSLENLASNQK
jgi:hypothetical protein